MKCLDCKYGSFDPPCDDGEYDLGHCTAMDDVVLPYAWRYSKREVVAIWAEDDIDCKRFERKPDGT